MFFPWVGLYEQVKVADLFVHYDDVNLPLGRSFITRVQIKTKDGFTWMTVPIDKKSRGGLINQARVSYESDWATKHLRFLENNYQKAPFRDEMLHLVSEVIGKRSEYLSDLNINSIEYISEYLGEDKSKFCKSSELKLTSSSSQRLVDACVSLKGDTYITGHGARNYMDHELFEQLNIRVEYMDYVKKEYEQMFGAFNPYISILDLIAMKGKQARNYLLPQTIYWKEFIKS